MKGNGLISFLEDVGEDLLGVVQSSQWWYRQARVQ